MKMEKNIKNLMSLCEVKEWQEREKMKVNGKSSYAKKIYDKSEKKAFFCRFQFGFETDEN